MSTTQMSKLIRKFYINDDKKLGKNNQKQSFKENLTWAYVYKMVE